MEGERRSDSLELSRDDLRDVVFALINAADVFQELKDLKLPSTGQAISDTIACREILRLGKLFFDFTPYVTSESGDRVFFCGFHTVDADA